jgi:hypothetical protein
MISQTGFRPSGRVLGAAISLSPSFPSYIDSYSPVYPYPTSVYAVNAPEVTVPAAAPPNGYASTTTMLVVGGIAITGAALLLTALARK